MLDFACNSLIPKNWEKFQHYKKRKPPWVKLHRSILEDRQFACLPLASKALAPLLWLLASESDDGIFNAEIEELAYRLHISIADVRAGLEPLIASGFFIVASRNTESASKNSESANSHGNVYASKNSKSASKNAESASNVLAETQNLLAKSSTEVNQNLKPNKISNEILSSPASPLTTSGKGEKIALPPEETGDPPDPNGFDLLPADGKPAFPPCPQQEILALYAEILPDLTQPRVWEGVRSTSLASRWRWALTELKRKGKTHDRDAGMDFFRRMFGYIAKSDFLMGRTKDAWGGCDLAWIVKAENFVKVIEGKYENRP